MATRDIDVEQIWIFRYDRLTSTVRRLSNNTDPLLIIYNDPNDVPVSEGGMYLDYKGWSGVDSPC